MYGQGVGLILAKTNNNVRQFVESVAIDSQSRKAFER